MPTNGYESMPPLMRGGLQGKFRPFILIDDNYFRVALGRVAQDLRQVRMRILERRYGFRYIAGTHGHPVDIRVTPYFCERIHGGAVHEEYSRDGALRGIVVDAVGVGGAFGTALILRLRFRRFRFGFLSRSCSSFSTRPITSGARLP